jgi:hypothetical protein
MTALYLRTSRHFVAADEMTALEKVPQAMRNPGGFGTLRDVPLIVISRGSRDPTTNSPTQPEWLAGQRRLLGLSSRATHVVAEESGHMVQFSEPQVIVEAGASKRRTVEELRVSCGSYKSNAGRK